MSRKPNPQFDEKQLSKGHLRKLTALRKSLGEDIADKAFSEWYASQGTANGAETDKNAEAIAATLWPLVEANEIKIPKTGYVLRRGRGRILVEPRERA